MDKKESTEDPILDSKYTRFAEELKTIIDSHLPNAEFDQYGTLRLSFVSNVRIHHSKPDLFKIFKLVGESYTKEGWLSCSIRHEFDYMDQIDMIFVTLDIADLSCTHKNQLLNFGFMGPKGLPFLKLTKEEF